jgi:hypothetical protein
MGFMGLMSLPALASDSDAHGCTEKLPWKREGCQGEMCNCRTGHSLKGETPLYAARSMRSKVLGKLKAGTRLQQRELTTVTLAYGKGVIHKFDGGRVDVVIAAKKNDGQYELCGGRLDEDSDTLQVLQEPKTEDWTKVTVPGGQVGWIRTSALRTTESNDCDFDPPAN